MANFYFSNSSEENNSETMTRTTCWACMYTKHKTQKRKVWNDGRLIITSSKGVLYDANPLMGSNDPILGECEITASFQAFLMRYQEHDAATSFNVHETVTLEMERYFVEIEGPWKKPSSSHATVTLPRPKLSSSMNKLMTSKFKKPKLYVPPRTNPLSREEQVLGKRNRSLQSGEFINRYHGSAMNGESDRQGRHGTQYCQNQKSTGEIQFHNDRNITHHRGDAITNNHSNQIPIQTSKSHNNFLYSSRNQNQENHQQQRHPTHDQSIVGKKSNSLTSSSFLGGNNRSVRMFEGSMNFSQVKSYPSKMNDNGFSRNEFDSTDFYGSEEEEEEENIIPQPLCDQFKSHAVARATSIELDKYDAHKINNYQSANRQNQEEGEETKKMQMQNDCPSQRQCEEKLTENRYEETDSLQSEEDEIIMDGDDVPSSLRLISVDRGDGKSTSTSSTERILSLFGAMPKQSPRCSIDSEINCKNNNSTSNSGNHDNVQKCSTNNNINNIHKIDGNPVSQPVQLQNNSEDEGISSGFYLAPAATSSESEDSSDDDENGEE